ncbi:putative SLACS reverse transcriptase [Trypanosoma cruzi]|uniref:Putative SLACS reverse transcriptase n=1 Tax=Trypanosoma cruzi TaxID=5693 RepID=A0A2V2UM83_TRYCR|nr:putative SLACS reverse transcriptase [Trypanosoma cruzi]
MEPTVAGHTTPAGHGRAGGLLRKGTIGPLVDVDAGSATGHGAGTGAFFHRHHRHPPPTGKQLPQRQLHGVPGRRYGGGTTGHAWAGMRGDIQSDACPGHRDERGQDGGPPYRRTSGHARGVHPAVCPRARCGIANDPESELITRFVQRKAEETDRLFRAIVELPFAKHTQWRLLSVSALPRVTFLLRTHAPVHTRAAAEWFDDRVTGVLGVIMDGPVTKRARDIAALPVRRGGCGLRRQKEIAEFAYACLGEKGKQHALTDELDAKHQSDLYETLQGPDRKVFVSNTAAGAGRPLTDPQVHADDRGFSTYLRERLLVRVLPEGQKCVCGADASNEHVHTCTRLQQNPRTTRHDMINMTFANGLRLCGFQCGMEPRLTEASRRRPDILIVGLDTYAITDVTVTYAGRVTAYVSEESMEEADPYALHGTASRKNDKSTVTGHWPTGWTLSHSSC